MSQKPHKRIIFCIFETTVCRFFRILGNQPNGSHLYSAGDTPTGTQIIDLTWGNTPFFLLVFSWNINYVDFYDSSIIISSLNQRKEAMSTTLFYIKQNAGQSQQATVSSVSYILDSNLSPLPNTGRIYPPLGISGVSLRRIWLMTLATAVPQHSPSLSHTAS